MTITRNGMPRIKARNGIATNPIIGGESSANQIIVSIRPPPQIAQGTKVVIKKAFHVRTKGAQKINISVAVLQPALLKCNIIVCSMLIICSFFGAICTLGKKLPVIVKTSPPKPLVFNKPELQPPSLKERKSVLTSALGNLVQHAAFKPRRNLVRLQFQPPPFGDRGQPCMGVISIVRRIVKDVGAIRVADGGHQQIQRAVVAFFHEVRRHWVPLQPDPVLNAGHIDGRVPNPIKST